MRSFEFAARFRPICRRAGGRFAIALWQPKFRAKQFTGGVLDTFDYLRIAIKSWRLVLAAVVVGIAFASAGFAIQPVVYASSSRILVSLENTDTPQELGRTAEELAMGRSFITGETAVYAQAVTATSVIEEALKSLGGELTAQELRLQIRTEVLGGNTIRINVAAGAAEASLERAEALTTAFIQEFGNADSRIRLALLEEPSLPTIPTTPGLATYVALGGFVGAAIGIGSAVLRHMLRGRVTSLKDVEANSPLTVIAGVNTFDVSTVNAGTGVDLLALASADGIQTLRSRALGATRTAEVAYHVVTSPLGGEGATTISTALATAISHAGRKVLLITPDSAPHAQAAGQMDDRTGVPAERELSNSSTEGRATEQLADGGLAVLRETWDTPQGRFSIATPDYWQRLASYCELNQVSDVVFDAPPILSSSVAMDLSRPDGILLLVVAANETRLPELSAASLALQDCDASLKAIVLNRIPVHSQEAARYGRFGYANADRDNH